MLRQVSLRTATSLFGSHFQSFFKSHTHLCIYAPHPVHLQVLPPLHHAFGPALLASEYYHFHVLMLVMSPLHTRLRSYSPVVLPCLTLLLMLTPTSCSTLTPNTDSTPKRRWVFPELLYARRLCFKRSPSLLGRWHPTCARPPVLQQWFRFLSPERLAIDTGHSPRRQRHRQQRSSQSSGRGSDGDSSDSKSKPSAETASAGSDSYSGRK